MGELRLKLDLVVVYYKAGVQTLLNPTVGAPKSQKASEGVRGGPGEQVEASSLPNPLRTCRPRKQGIH